MKIRAIFMFAGLCALAGCSAAQDSGEEGTTASTEPLFSTLTWSQNSTARTGMAVSDGFCFLTSISGGFRGGGEYVQLDVINGYWTLSGGSGQSGVGATAACVRWSELGSSGGSVVYASPFATFGSFATSNSHDLCYMTGFTGETNGGGEGVSVGFGGSGYVMSATHRSGSGMSGKMTCVRSVGGRPFSFNNSYHLAQNGTAFCTNSTTCYNSLPMQSTGRMYCMLDQLAGKMRGGGELASVVRNTDTYWTLNADSMQGCADGGCALNATATCLYY